MIKVVENILELLYAELAHLREGATDVPHVGPGGLVDVDGRDCDLQPRPQSQQEAAHVQLPGLTGRHQESPAYEETHHGERQQGSLPADGVHQEDSAQRTKQGSDTQQTACRD